MMNNNNYWRLYFSLVLLAVLLICVDPIKGQLQQPEVVNAPKAKTKLVQNLIQFRKKIHQQLRPYSYRNHDRLDTTDLVNEPIGSGRSDLERNNDVRQAHYQQVQQRGETEMPYYPPQNNAAQQPHRQHVVTPTSISNHNAQLASQQSQYYSINDEYAAKHYTARPDGQLPSDQRFQRYSNQMTASERVVLLTNELARIEQVNRSFGMENQRLRDDLQQNRTLLAETTQAVDDSIEKLNMASQTIRTLQDDNRGLKTQLANQRAESSKMLKDIRGQLNALIAQEISNGR